MNEKMKYWMSQVYKWQIKGDKVQPPKMDLPKCVIERIEFFQDQIDDGLTYYGALTAVLAINEEQTKHDIELGGEWLPVSDEFRKWLHGEGIDQIYSDYREMMIAVALIYGWDDNDEQRD